MCSVWQAKGAGRPSLSLLLFLLLLLLFPSLSFLSRSLSPFLALFPLSLSLSLLFLCPSLSFPALALSSLSPFSPPPPSISFPPVLLCTHAHALLMCRQLVVSFSAVLARCWAVCETDAQTDTLSLPASRPGGPGQTSAAAAMGGGNAQKTAMSRAKNAAKAHDVPKQLSVGAWSANNAAFLHMSAASDNSGS